MGHKDKNDELREERLDQEERRQEARDEALEDADGRPADLGSQDRRRHDDLPPR